jgi:hypothetical protein
MEHPPSIRTRNFIVDRAGNRLESWSTQAMRAQAGSCADADTNFRREHLPRRQVGIISR